MDAAAMLPVKKQDPPQIPRKPPHLAPLPKKEEPEIQRAFCFPASRLVSVLFSQGQMLVFYFAEAAMNFFSFSSFSTSLRGNLGHGGNPASVLWLLLGHP